jgi:5-formyltetrahydrofolate cyclo-ligase
MTKKEIRDKYKLKRSQLTEAEIDQLTLLIISQINKNLDLKNKTISIYLPIKKHKEINTFSLIDTLRLNSNTIAIPKTNFENYSMVHYVFSSKENLEETKFGILEPKDGEEVKNSAFDIVFVPLLSLDSKGNRVGYGKGFYDRLLSNCSDKCIFIGLHLFVEMEEIDDVNELDIKLDLCITPKRFIQFNTLKEIPLK